MKRLTTASIDYTCNINYLDMYRFTALNCSWQSHRPSLPYIRRCNSERFVAYKHVSDGKGTYRTSRPRLDLGPGQLYNIQRLSTETSRWDNLNSDLWRD